METLVARERKNRKPYETPTLTKLTLEQARLKLAAHTPQGNEVAEELLGLMSLKTSIPKKKGTEPNLRGQKKSA